MSHTYSIVCKDCKVSLWIAQGWPNDLKSLALYSGNQKIMTALECFLFSHKNHNLVFMDDENMDNDIIEIDIDED